MIAKAEGKRHFVSIPDTQHRLGGVSRNMVYDLIDRGDLVRVKVGRRAVITTESINAYVDRLKTAAAAAS